MGGYDNRRRGDYCSIPVRQFREYLKKPTDSRLIIKNTSLKVKEKLHKKTCIMHDISMDHVMSQGFATKIKQNMISTVHLTPEYSISKLAGGNMSINVITKPRYNAKPDLDEYIARHYYTIRHIKLNTDINTILCPLVGSGLDNIDSGLACNMLAFLSFIFNIKIVVFVPNRTIYDNLMKGNGVPQPHKYLTQDIRSTVHKQTRIRSNIIFKKRRNVVSK